MGERSPTHGDADEPPASDDRSVLDEESTSSSSTYVGKFLALKLLHLPHAARVILMAILLYVLVGTMFVDLEWWRTFFFEGGIFSWSHWSDGLSYVYDNFSGPTLIALLGLFLIYWLLPLARRRKIPTYWRTLCTAE